MAPVHWARVEREMPGFEPFAGGSWLEEDCDVTLAVLLWPELFEGHAIWGAVHACLGQPTEGGYSRALSAGRKWLEKKGEDQRRVLMLAAAWQNSRKDGIETWEMGKTGVNVTG